MSDTKALMSATIEVTEHPETGYTFTTVNETRGVRSSEVVILNDLPEHFLWLEKDPMREYAELIKAAKRMLKNAKQKTPAEIRTIAVSAQPRWIDSGFDRRMSSKAEAEQFEFWRSAFELGRERGFLSPEAIAANFMATSLWMHRLLGKNPQLLRAAIEFARAWQHLHFEANGDHEHLAGKLALLEGAIETKVKGLSLGPQKRAANAQQKRKVIHDAFKKYLADGGSKEDGLKRIARKMLVSVNESLAEKDKMDEPALLKALREVAKHHR